MNTYERTLKVNKTGAYVMYINDWANGEAITNFSVTSDALCTIVTQVETNAAITFTATGVSVGKSEIHFTFETATTSDCTAAFINVVDDC